MNLLLDFGCAWISVLLAFLLSIIYILRKALKKSNCFKNTIKKLNLILRKYHKHLGVLLVATGLIHGLFSSESIWTFNFGTITWIVTILLGLNWMFREYLKKK